LTVARLQRAKWRSRRGMRELDVLLNQFIETSYSDLNAIEQDDFDSLLTESDVDLYSWFTGRTVPENMILARLVDQIRHCGD
jgi:antitoxin CptB